MGLLQNIENKINNSKIAEIILNKISRNEHDFEKKKKALTSSEQPNPSIPNGTRSLGFKYTFRTVELIFEARTSQLEAYKKRKEILFKRMKLGMIGSCILIIFLVWSQWYFPQRNRQFWSKGLIVKIILRFACNLVI